MTKTYLIRHADWRYCSDAVTQELSFKGKKQAVVAAYNLMKIISPGRVNIMTSPVERAALTAKWIGETLARHNYTVDLQIVDELGESYGNHWNDPEEKMNAAYSKLRTKIEDSPCVVIAVTHEPTIKELSQNIESVANCGIVVFERLPEKRNTGVSL